MKILVTGGAGFIGSHIVALLLNNNFAVTIVDNLSTGSMQNVNPKATFINMDISDTEIHHLFEKESFDYVIHQAAQTMVPRSIDDPHFDSSVNIQGTLNILEACRKTGVKRIVFASSAAVYGDASQVPVSELTVTKPTSFYGLSKLTVEEYLNLYHQLYGLEYVVLRYANVYGERQGDTGEGGVISIFCRKIKKGQTLSVFGDGEQTRDFIYAGDVAEANYRAMLCSNPNAVYNIGTKSETSINGLIDVLKDVSGSDVNVLSLAPREGDIYRSVLDNDAAISGLGWTPKVSLKDGLSRTFGSVS